MDAGRQVDDKNCPLCGENTWDLDAARVVFLPDAQEEQGSPAGPIVQIACNNCGHIELLDAYKLGSGE
jgi:hypothetical protein